MTQENLRLRFGWIIEQTGSIIGRQVANRFCRLILITLVFISIIPFQIARAEIPNPGIYIGDFTYYPYGASYSEINGITGILLSGDGSAIITSFPTPSNDAFAPISSSVVKNVSIDADGNFEHVWDFICYVGQLKKDAVSGDYNAWTGDPDPELACSGADWGDFFGSRMSNVGGLTDGGGFYEGTVSGKVTFQGEPWADISGDVAVMLSGDGTAFIVVDACALHGPTCTIVDDGGVTKIADDGTISAVLYSGTVLSGFLDPSEIGTPGCCSAQGTFYAESSNYVSSGTWSVIRKISLPKNIPPVAVPDQYSTKLNQVLIVSVPGVLINDNDNNGDRIEAILMNQPSHGIIAFQPDGSFSYKPNGGFRGTDKFTYQTTDGLLKSEPVLVNILVGRTAFPWLYLLLGD
jgi:hypothetical protein